MSRSGLVEREAMLAIVRRGSSRAAAVDLGMPTTALSNAIGKLERQIDVRLFNRTTRSVSLTDAGRTFVGQVGPAVESIQDAMTTARSQQETPSGTLHINAFATAVAPDQLEADIRSHPPVLLIHGTDDDVVPFRSMDLAKAALTAVGVSVETPVSPGVAHSIGQDGLDAATTFTTVALG